MDDGGGGIRDVRVTVRPLADDDAAYADARIGGGVALDVVLHAGDARFVHIQRCLHDFVQLEHDLHREHGDDARALETLPTVVDAIRAYVAEKKKKQQQQRREAVARSLLYPAHLVEPRFAWQLETYLASLIAHKSASLRGSQALQRFLEGDVAHRVALDGDDRERYAHLVETLLATHGARADAVDDERIASGCSVEHTVRVRCAGDGDEPATHLMLWKFTSRGDHVAFAARFTHENGSLRSADEDAAADPYSAVEDPYQSTGGACCEEDAVLSVQDGPLSEFMVQYRTQYAFAGDATPQECVYGHFVTATSGALALEWSNEDASSVLSKPLAFHVHVVPLVQAAGAGRELVEVFDRKRGGDEHDAAWVSRLIRRSAIQSLDDVAFASSDDAHVSMPVVDTAVRQHESSFASEAEELQRLREEKHFHEQRAADLEARVAYLEDTLRDAKRELKKAQDDIEISGEIYKASLETIAQLEMHAPVATPPAEAGHTADPPVAATGAGACPRGLHGAFDAKEYQRVVDLCTTFQEQCLWRSIEVAESEKRNLSLDAKLAQVSRENAELVAQLETRNALVVDLRAQNQTLKAHKSLLVREVKKLRPFSQINVAALVQDAQEARMMQRSLQAQLNAASREAPAETPLAADEEESEPGFVVIESKDHSSDGEADALASA